MNDCITTTKQSTTKPCAYFLGYTVVSVAYVHQWTEPSLAQALLAERLQTINWNNADNLIDSLNKRGI